MEVMRDYAADRFFDRSHFIIPVLGHCYFGIRDLVSAEQCFASLGIEYVSCSEARKCLIPLCLEWWFFWIMFAHLMIAMFQIRKAKYMIQIAMKKKPFDGHAFYLYSIIMYRLGKYQKALKYYRKYKKSGLEFTCFQITNQKMFECYEICLVSLINGDINMENKIVIENECNFCGIKGIGFKKCKQCKVVFYCSRKCQKADWKVVHREHCSFKAKPSAEDWIHAYLIGIDNISTRWYKDD